MFSFLFRFILTKHYWKYRLIEVFQGFYESFICSNIGWFVLDIPGIDRHPLKRMLF